jgi:DNA-binding beta-propeller fold protein YncE
MRGCEMLQRRSGLIVLMAIACGHLFGPSMLYGQAGSTSAQIKGDRIQLPGGEAGIGFDDLQFSSTLKQVLVPGGRTGKLFLMSPATHEVTSIDGFSSKASYGGGHGDGTTSACEEGGLVYASDRGSGTMKIVDPAARKIVASVRLAGAPDYVRCLAASHEVWVTEPGKEQIEIFALGADGRSATSAGKVSAPGGPESLVLDTRRMRGYTHTWKGTSYAIDLKKRSIAEKWSNGCQGARGIALDEEKGWLFVGCEEGKAVVLDVTSGKTLSSLSAGSGIDSIGYAASLGSVYVPGGDSADLSILGVSSTGGLSFLGKVTTGPDAHTAAFDPDTRTVFVGLPEHGQVLILKAGFETTPR